MQTESAPTEGLELIADPHKVAQVIRNLVSNALKFTSSGGLVTVTMSVEENDCLESKDTTAIETGAIARNWTVLQRYLPCFREEAFNRIYSFRDNSKYTLVLSVKDSGAGISEVRDST